MGKIEVKSRSVFVWGPKGCGKTTNAQRIAEALGLKSVLDDVPSNRRVAEYGSLSIGESPEQAPRGFGESNVMSYEEAMKRVAEYEMKNRSFWKRIFDWLF